MESRAGNTAAAKAMRGPSQQSLFGSNQLESKAGIAQVFLQKTAPPANGQPEMNSVWKQKSGAEHSVKKHFDLFLIAVILLQAYLQCIPSASGPNFLFNVTFPILMEADHTWENVFV